MDGLFDEKNGEIRVLVENFASRRVKSFYPESIQQEVGLSLDDIVIRMERLRYDNIVQLKFEVRCEQDFSPIITVDNYTTVLGKNMVCPECGREVTVSESCIYPKYFITDSYREFVKKKRQNQIHRAVLA